MERQESKNDELIRGLPDDCAMQCLARVSRKCMPSVKGVCRRWRDMLVDKNSLFYKLRLCHNLEHNEGARSSSKSEGREKDQSVVLSRYELQKRRDWHTFGHYLVSHSPPLALNICSGEHVVEYLRSLDQFGKTKIHNPACPFFGNPHPPASCPCPMKQAWGSLDALVGRLRGAYDANLGKPESNPFGAPNVRLYLREVRQMQATARGVPYKKRKSPTDAQLEQPQRQQEQVQMSQNQSHHCHNQVHVSAGNPVNSEPLPSNRMGVFPTHN